MRVKLSAGGLRALSEGSPTPFVARVSEQPMRPEAERSREVLLVAQPVAELPPGFRGYLLRHRVDSSNLKDLFLLGSEHHYVQTGDVVRIDPGHGMLTALYRASSRFNTFFVTGRCDNLCVMCSQPPQSRDDSWLVDDIERAIPLISPDAAEIGITGGEPALLGDRLVRLLVMLRTCLPQTAIHVLTNGRRFSDASFARAVADVQHPDLMLGIPLYSDLPEEHDYIVQAKGAFDETVRGILNLKRRRVRVELRFVIHRETAERLTEFARFVARNLTFVDHVALMGLEIVGYARLNLDRLWIDPLDYQDVLRQAVLALDHAGVPVSVYNHQLCTLDPEIHPFARKSISDWKNEYFEECSGCASRGDCGGFFASASLRRSRAITGRG